jgi:hypothetical protein
VGGSEIRIIAAGSECKWQNQKTTGVAVQKSASLPPRVHHADF